MRRRPRHAAGSPVGSGEPPALCGPAFGACGREALSNIAMATLANVAAFERGEPLVNEVRAEHVLQ